MSDIFTDSHISEANGDKTVLLKIDQRTREDCQRSVKRGSSFHSYCRPIVSLFC